MEVCFLDICVPVVCHVNSCFNNLGNLEDYVLELKRSLDVQEIWHLFLDLTFGLDYLHSKGIIHVRRVRSSC